jgi:hypothetical protein
VLSCPGTLLATAVGGVNGTSVGYIAG